MAIDGGVDCRDGMEDAGLSGIDSLQDLLQFEARQKNELCPHRDAVVHDRGHGEHMKERQDGEDSLFALDGGHQLLKLAGVGHQIGVGEHGPLWNSGGAAGILQDGDIFMNVDMNRVGRTVGIDQHFIANMAKIFRDIGQFAPLEGGKQQAFYRRQNIAHLADNDLLEPGGIQRMRDFRIELA